MNVYDTLNERGFIEQLRHYGKIQHLLEAEKVVFYIGFDATSDSLTAGHLLTLMAVSHMQKAGHMPIILIGAGTAMIGDPSGKTDMRKMLTEEQINYNANAIKLQISKIINMKNDNAILVNNADWLKKLNYIDVLRNIGPHFSVNRMLSADCYKSRYERGLTFLEFNYMILQAYDFLELNRTHNCILRLGGNDQWSNIISGTDLIRRLEKKPSFGITFPLLTTSDGKKMGKTEAGAVWLDPVKTSPYDFYQYWRNIEDTKVKECLLLLTFLPVEEILKLSYYTGEKINVAKKVLAFEITKIVHGEDAAIKALTTADDVFNSKIINSNIPTTIIKKENLGQGISIIALLIYTRIVKYKAEARRLIEQGGIKINNKKIEDINYIIMKDDYSKDEIIILQKGKKIFHNLKFS